MLRFLPARYTESRDWLETPRARLFLQYEQRLLRELLPRLTGYRCVQVGRWGIDRALLDHAGTLRQWRLAWSAGTDADALFDGQHLPLASGSVDALVLAHSLEQVAAPHALLRECARVLSARGQLIVLVFNPWSLWALWQGMPGRRAPRFTPCAAPPSAGRLFDWLRLLEFEPDLLWRYGLGFPLFGGRYAVGSGKRWLEPLACAAQAYAVLARRQVVSRNREHGRTARSRAAAPAALARTGTGGLPYRR
ncbi:methyltransferase [Salinisphaera orenii MK-B5]|uniref:Methyltransferase n=1 Tax=Salinisphaera orenii MK-B5 TaxID=856730 RepID=A0A423PUF4_9GAMM|nr:methyltransferase [Salinisphaera orenii MK-B5]